MMGTSNTTPTASICVRAVSHGKMMGTSNPPTVRPSGSQAVSHGKKESTSSKSDSLHQKKEHPNFSGAPLIIDRIGDFPKLFMEITLPTNPPASCGRRSCSGAEPCA